MPLSPTIGNSIGKKKKKNSYVLNIYSGISLFVNTVVILVNVFCQGWYEIVYCCKHRLTFCRLISTTMEEVKPNLKDLIRIKKEKEDKKPILKRKNDDLYDIDPISEDEDGDPGKYILLIFMWPFVTNYVLLISLKICLGPQAKRIITHRLCPYLDTINRHVLDFDFEKLCSISLSRINVYACLVCGKYFQGIPLLNS